MWSLLVVAATLALSCSGPKSHEIVAPAIAHRTEVVFLGTGVPFPDPERSGPSTAIVVDGVAYLFDCGPGVVRRAQQAAERHHLDALQPQNIRFAFITHLHSDHTLGYPDLLLTPWVIGREWPLEVYGPPGIARMTDQIREAYAEDIEIRSHGSSPDDVAASRANVHEVAPGLVYQDEHVRVFAVPVKHGDWKYAFGYRIEGPDRTIVITGDESPNDAIVEACNGCDVLVSEGYLQAIFDKADSGRRAYMAAYHTSGIELGRIATKARAKAVVITHQRPRPVATNATLIEEVHRNFAGPVRIANDLDRI
jgi:ribonuclease Z